MPEVHLLSLTYLVIKTTEQVSAFSPQQDSTGTEDGLPKILCSDTTSSLVEVTRSAAFLIHL